MKYLLVGVALVVTAETAVASFVAYSAEKWLLESPAVVVGRVVSSEPLEPRELDAEQYAGWLFPRGMSRIVVTEVLKNATDRDLAAGDTVTVRYLTGGTATNPEEPGWGMKLTSIARIDLEPDTVAAFAMSPDDVGWKFTYSLSIKSEDEIPTLQNLVAELSIETWVRSSPTIVVIDQELRHYRERRRLASGDHPECYFDHLLVRVVVADVLKNQTIRGLAAGDTITICYPWSNVGHNPARPGMVKVIEEAVRPVVRPGAGNVVVLRPVQRTRWHTNTHYAYRPGHYVPAIREAVEQEWLGSLSDF